MKEAKRLWSWLAIPCIALAVLTGSILPVLLVFMAIICTDKHVMGKYAVGKFTRVILCFTIVVVGILSAICLVMQILGIG